MSYIRTPEHRAIKAALIRNWKPWERSTGPKSPEGKQSSAVRGYKGRERVMMRDLARALKRQQKGLVFDR
jgi:hypothetical protein